MILRTFGWSFGVTIVSLIAALLYGGWSALVLCLILGILEVSLSFDNAVVNATVLERMSEFWQKIFLTIGILIAVFGMRLVFPLLIVGITADLGPIEAVQLALEKGDPETPGTYGYLLNEAHPLIAAFGGMFLLMLFLDWLFEDRDIKWLSWLERPLAAVGKLDALSVIVAADAARPGRRVPLRRGRRSRCCSPVSWAWSPTSRSTVSAPCSSQRDRRRRGRRRPKERAATAAGNDGVPARKGGPTTLAKATGKAGFFLFLYLEVLDASFSLRRRHRRVRHHLRPDHHRAGPGPDRRDVRPVDHRVPRAPGHPAASTSTSSTARTGRSAPSPPSSC